MWKLLIGKKVRYLYLILFLTLLNSLYCFDETNIKSSYPLSKTIHYSFTLKNENNKTQKNIEFWTYAPVKQTSYQYCETIKTSYKYDIEEDSLGNQILHFKFDLISPYDTKIINIQTEVLLSQKAVPILFSDKENEFIKSDNHIEIDNESIIKLAKTLKVNNNSYDSAKNIYNWVIDNIEYSRFTKDPLGALYALNNRKGDCTEFMYLFVALCRVNKISSRGVLGCFYKEDSKVKPQDLHNWAEFYDENVWKIVDSQKKNFQKNQSNYIAMRIMSRSQGNSMQSTNKFRINNSDIKVIINK